MHVLEDSENPGQTLGYYTLSATQMNVAELSNVDKKKLPRYPVPCFRISRLACRADQRGKGLGKLLLLTQWIAACKHTNRLLRLP